MNSRIQDSQTSFSRQTKLEPNPRAPESIKNRILESLGFETLSFRILDFQKLWIVESMTRTLIASESQNTPPYSN